jgi:hypothetical protein
MQLTTRFLIASILLALLSQGCNREGRAVTTEPTITEVAGRYHLSRTSFGNSADSEILSKAKDAYIELNTNGVAILHKLPIVPESDSQRFQVQEFRSGSGTFSISALGGTSKSTFYGLYLECGKLPDPISHPQLELRGKTLSLSFEYFDGDFTSRMEFTRSE